MANQYDTNLKLQAIADAIGDSGSSGLISALEDIADAVAGGGGGGSSTAGLVSDNFSETDTYDLGDFCIHNNTLYVCINAITTPGAWDLSDWQATNAGLELSSLNSALTDANCKIGAEMVASVTWNEVGWTPLNNIDNIVTPPALSGYSCIGFIIKQTSTYRIIAPYVYYSSGSWNVAFYAVNTSATSGTISMYPIYRKY